MPANLQGLWITECDELEEIIVSEGVELKKRAMVPVEFCLLQYKGLVLKRLPGFKSICSVDRVVVCDSLDYISVTNSLKLRRMPLYVSRLHNFRPSPSTSLSLSVYIEPKEWWESVEWYRDDTKSLLKPFLSLL